MAQNSPPLSTNNNNNNNNIPDSIQYWCYHCNKRVPIETLPNNPDVISCFECKNGFVESITNEETPLFGNEFLQVLRLIAQAAREHDEPPPPSPPPNHWTDDNDNDYLRIELDGWDGGNYVATDDEDQESRDHVRSRWYFDEQQEEDDNNNIDINNNNINDIEHDEEEQIDEHNEQNDDEDDVSRERRDVLRNRNDEQIEDRIDEHNEHDDVSGERRDVLRLRIRHLNDEQDNDDDDDDDVRRERRDVLRVRLRQVVSRAASRHNRIMDWGEIMGLGDQSIEFRLRVNVNDDAYVGNPGDYVDAAGYEALLETLAESDMSGRRGAPPAAKSAIENLHTVEVDLNCIEICAVCKDRVWNNEGKVVKQLECGHMYHDECIVPWLGSRNTCPVCRFELPTDDAEYEEDRKKRLITMAAAGDDGGCSSSSGAVE